MSNKFDNIVRILADNRAENVVPDYDSQEFACAIYDFLGNSSQKGYSDTFIASGLYAILYTFGWDEEAHTIAQAIWEGYFSQDYPY